MNKFLYHIAGILLLFPLYASQALGISIDTFRNEVLRPENLPTGAQHVSVETKITTAFQFGINLVLYASGGVAVLFLVIGGIRYIVSFGNEDQMNAAKKTILYAVIGLVIVILAFALITNIIDIIYRATA